MSRVLVGIVCNLPHEKQAKAIEALAERGFRLIADASQRPAVGCSFEPGESLQG